jgi:hypothetical protein
VDSIFTLSLSIIACSTDCMRRTFRSTSFLELSPRTVLVRRPSSYLLILHVRTCGLICRHKNIDCSAIDRLLLHVLHTASRILCAEICVKYSVSNLLSPYERLARNVTERFGLANSNQVLRILLAGGGIIISFFYSKKFAQSHPIINKTKR